MKLGLGLKIGLWASGMSGIISRIRYLLTLAGYTLKTSDGKYFVPKAEE